MVIMSRVNWRFNAGAASVLGLGVASSAGGLLGHFDYKFSLPAGCIAGAATFVGLSIRDYFNSMKNNGGPNYGPR